METYPLFFSYGGLVAGRGYLASVQIDGRCLFERTSSEFVSYFGVNPGGVAGQGSGQQEASRDFLEHVRLVVFELAEEAESFDRFKKLVKDFVQASNPRAGELWSKAVEAVRAGKVDKSKYSREVPAEQPAAVRVREVRYQPSAMKPALNRRPSESIGIAA